MENYLRIWYNDNFVNKYNHDDFLKIVLKDCYSKMVFTNRLKICLIFPSTLSRSIYFVSSHSSTPPLGSQAVAWGTKAPLHQWSQRARSFSCSRFFASSLSWTMTQLSSLLVIPKCILLPLVFLFLAPTTLSSTRGIFF